ncbi:phage holin family protein [Gimesia sp.]|uniref:phage holin family protein n=1 Tax=Gimesia sp. TaxID=2024833 RepID=UPI003A8DF689
MIGQNGTVQSEYKPDMRGDLGDLGADLLALSELQVELLSVDTRDAIRESFSPTIFLALGLGLCAGAFPVLLLACAWWMSNAFELTLASSMLTVSVSGLFLASGFLYFAWKGFKKSLRTLQRSGTELRSNIDWIKTIISDKHRNRQSPYQRK